MLIVLHRLEYETAYLISQLLLIASCQLYISCIDHSERNHHLSDDIQALPENLVGLCPQLHYPLVALVLAVDPLIYHSLFPAVFAVVPHCPLLHNNCYQLVQDIGGPPHYCDGDCAFYNKL